MNMHAMNMWLTNAATVVVGVDWTLHPRRHNNVGGVTAGQVGHNSSNVGGVTAGQVGHNSSNVGGVTAGQVGHNSSSNNKSNYVEILNALNKN